MLEVLQKELVKNSLCLEENASRLFHGRGHQFDGLSFINIDWFSPVIWVVIYGDVDEAVVSSIQTLLIKQLSILPQVQAIVMQRRVAGRAQQEIIFGTLADKNYAHEEGMRYELNLSQNQNIGFFLDASPARQWLRQHADNKRVLNLFAYTCAFSVAAMQGGAAQVVNIDMAKSAIATGQKNHALNKVDISKVRFLPHDIFRSTRKLQDLGPYDLIVIDPPSRQKGSFEAEKDYGRLLKKLEPMLAEGAMIVACLNAPYLGETFLLELFAEHLPQYEWQERLAQRNDFPEKDINCALKMHIFKAKL